MSLTSIANNTTMTFSQAIQSELMEVFPNIVASIGIFFVFYLLALLSRQIIRRAFKKLNTYEPLIELAAKISFVVLILVGLITALGTAGVNVSAMVASLGLFGFTLGYAFKDLLSNTLAGVMILFYRPFKIGDKISGKEFVGHVKEVNLRYTVLDDHDHHILVPNSSMLNNIVNVYPSE